jgi:toxin ParE1/3/4
VSRKIVRQPRARRDIVACALYIEEQNPRAARRFLAAVERTINGLAASPWIGPRRDYDNPRLVGLRMFPVRGFEKHLIFYRPTENGIEIVRVLHAARDLDEILREER